MSQNTNERDEKAVVVDGKNSNQIEVEVSVGTASKETMETATASYNLRSWPEDIDREATGCGMGRWAVRVYNNWTYSFMNPILKMGSKQNKTMAKQEKQKKKAILDNGDEDDDMLHLTSDDLYPVPRHMTSDRLVRNFESKWKQIAVAAESNDGNNNNSDSLRDTKRRLLYSLWKVAIPTFLPAGIFQFVSTVSLSCYPLIVRRFLEILEDQNSVSVIDLGLKWSLLLATVTIVYGLTTQRYRHQSMKTGIALRAAIVNMIYRRVLELSPAGKRGLTSGEINNLVAVDAQKLYEVMQEAHLIWSLPLSVALVTGLLCQVMGRATLVGIFTLVAFLPIIKLVTKRVADVRAKRVKLSDDRVEITVSMLLGMRNTKLNGFESKYQERLQNVRKSELKLLAKEQAWWASTLLITVSSPVLATAFTFTTYVLTSTDNKPHILTAADTFGVLLLFGALRFPLNFGGKLIGDAAQALSALTRIAVFLERPVRETTPLLLGNEGSESGNENNKQHIPLVLTRARFSVGIPPDNPSSFETKTTATNTNAAGNTSDGPELVNTAMVSAIENGGSRDNLSFMVGTFDFELKRGEVMVVCGPVGSGKSTLINGILEEADPLPLPTQPDAGNALAAALPMVQRRGRISYAPQDPFILNQSLRENILFGSEFDMKRYNRVLDACALWPDIQQLGGSDLVQIGERGVTLSGGQRQRVSLARAAYKEADSACVILDDPFSALDSGTGKIVFERLIAAPNALLKNSAVLLVTHASHFISHKAVNKILLMVNGRNEFLGTWEELTTFNDEEHDEETKRAVDHIQSQVRENTDGEDKDNKSSTQSAKTAKELNDYDDARTKDTAIRHGYDVRANENKIMQKELREHGLSSMKTWLLWFQRAGGLWFGFAIITLLAIDRFAYVAVEWFLAMWTAGAYEPVTILGVTFPAQSDGQSLYLKIFFAINFVSLLATALRSEFAVTGGVRATKNVFNSMLESVLRAPMSYFDTVPMGRLLNRFTYDTDVNDVTLTQKISLFIISCSWYVAGLFVMVSILTWSALVLIPISAAYLFFLNYYRMTGPDLQRIDALSRSPMQSMVSECLEGSTSIRVFHQDPRFVRRFMDIVDVNSSALLNYVSAQRWLSVRMEVLGSVVVLTTLVLVVCLNERLQTSAGLAGLLIIWSSNFTMILGFIVQNFTDTEAAITAIERVDAMAELPTEKAMETPKELQPSPEWPRNGSLEFRNVSLRYREELPLALNNLSFSIPAGKTCGIVGRTGAGKSSITVALFRLVEIEPNLGSILLDGIDLTKLGLSDVRGRGMSIIPQDPFLTGANLRECLDPFEQRTDEEILDALESVRMGISNTKTVGNDVYTPEQLLATKLEEGGSNYSVGERQLLNLARALLSQPKVLVLDEATASIDGETDSFIQKMLRTRFPQTTLLTIAHRLNTIMDYDCVLVMDAGRAAEFDAPAKLLENKEGIFSQLVDATGAESSKALRQMAIESFQSKQ